MFTVSCLSFSNGMMIKTFAANLVHFLEFSFYKRIKNPVIALATQLLLGQQAFFSILFEQTLLDSWRFVPKFELLQI